MRAVSFMLWLATATAAWGQAADPNEDPLFESVTGSFFALSVADVASSSRWYAEKLGLEVVMEVRAGEGQPGAIVLEGGGLIVELSSSTASSRSVSSSRICTKQWPG